LEVKMSGKKLCAGIVIILVIAAITPVSMSKKFHVEEEGIVKIPIEVKIGKIERLSGHPMKFNMLPIDTKVTDFEGDDKHPDIEIDMDGNSVLVYETDSFGESSQIYMQRSPDQGKTWPGEQIFPVIASEEFGAINPSIDMLSEENRAFVTFQIEEAMPTLYFVDLYDIDDPETWMYYSFDLSSVSEYCGETAISARGKTLSLSIITDYRYGDYDLQETLITYWTTEITEDLSGATFSGVVWIIEEPKSHPVATAGEEKIFVACQVNDPERSYILVTYAPINAQDYTEWQSTRILYRGK